MVVDDDAQLRDLAKLVLERDGWDVVAAADSYEAAVESQATADAAVVALRLGGKSGVELARELTERGVKVLIWTGAKDREAIRAALRSGARGVALKGEPISELAAALRKVAGGGEYIAPGLRSVLATEPGQRLTPRERQVLFLLATGLTNREVAAQLGVSPETTRTQLKTAMRKLDAHTRVQAVAIAVAAGEITLP